MTEKTDFQKLKDLFIEYHGEGVYGIIEPEHGIYLREAMQARAPYIISKRYGFIKWLVENNKIDTRKIDEDRLETIQYSEKERVTICDRLLMLLAIQDEPINFLLEILK